jgi:hypothetical protein
MLAYDQFGDPAERGEPGLRRGDPSLPVRDAPEASGHAADVIRVGLRSAYTPTV